MIDPVRERPCSTDVLSSARSSGGTLGINSLVATGEISIPAALEDIVGHFDDVGRLFLIEYVISRLPLYDSFITDDAGLFIMIEDFYLVKQR